jgi:type II secretion system protein D
VAKPLAKLSPEERAALPITTRIEEPQMDGQKIATFYRKYTGRRVIVSAAASQMTINFMQDPPLTYGEAAELLKKQALLEGLVFVPAGPGVDKLVIAAGGPQKPAGNGLKLYTDAEDLPEGDEVVSYVMTLDNIKPDEAVRTFTQVIGQFGSYGSIAAVPNASAVVITENTALIRSLIALKNEIDVPSANITTRFVKVQYADVTELAETLNEILNGQSQQKRSAGVQRAPSRNLPPGVPNPNAGATGSGGAGEDVPVQIVAEGRTNRLFVMGRPIDVVFVEGLIQEFDSPTDRRNYLRRKLRFLSVSEFLPIANDALARTLGDQQGGGSRGRPSGGGSSRGNFAAQQTRSTAQRGSSGRSGRSGGRDSGFSGGGTGAGSMLSDPAVNSAPESMLIGRTLLVADNISNSIIVQGPPQSLEIITTLLDEIDVKAEQVMISTVFGQLSLNDDLDYGVDWVFTADNNTDRPLAGQSRTRKAILGDLVDPATLLTPESFTNLAGLSLYGQLTDNLFGYIKALESTGRFSVLSRPTIFTTNNQRGVISSGKRIAVPTNSYQGGVSTGISTNIEYRDVVLSLEVIPLVNSKDEVTLTIALLNDAVIGSQRIEGVGDVPTIGTEELITTVTVPNGATVVLGGLITVTDRDSVSGIPILSSIPGLGKLFSTTGKEQERHELIIFIQPTIVNDGSSLARAQDNMNGRYDSAGDVLDFGADPAVLPPRPVEHQWEEPAAPRPPRAIPVRNANRPPGRPGGMFRR